MAKIADLLAAGPTFSFEFFPPKSDAEQATLVRALYELQPLNPSFVSVTYRGGRSSRDRTHDLVAGMLKTTSLNPMAHLICVAHTRLELAEIMVDFRKAGVHNLMALGGDPPTDADAIHGELLHAIELVELARAIGGFSIGVAAHPAGHPRSPDLDTDREHLCAKLELADFAITQFFFRLGDYLGLVEQVSARGLDKPIIPGIMPITSLASVPRMATMGAAVPPELVSRLEAAERRGGDDAVRQAGTEAATELCEKLLAEGAPGLHFYTLNRSHVTRQIYASLGLS
ncbi:MAG TPA: methylenetetrahydrofolate reductase [Acidimicrobiales bacterium]|jgi:methylenetetrahydrofolate reductase (NADPH)|nr:methylenetetrahydrofolate reductase [Acidimicrobiales bacterium]